MYENNYKILSELVKSGDIIIPVSEHRKPDGTFDLERNKKTWNAAIERFDRIPLWENGAPDYNPEKDPLQPEPSIIFVPAQGQKERKGTILVAHGGAFQSRTGCEGINVAYYYANAGFNTAILTYRLEPYTRFDAINDMQRAIRYLRAKKDEFGITDKVCVMGFSAGGMLSAICSTHYDYGNESAEDPIDRPSCRPDATVISYGIFTFIEFPAGMMINPFENENIKEMYYLAPEANVNPDNPPFFIWQTISDDPRHSFTLGNALTAAGVPFEMHIFPEGIHGLALADGNNDLGSDLPHVAHWAELCTEWLQEKGI